MIEHRSSVIGRTDRRLPGSTRCGLAARFPCGGRARLTRNLRGLAKKPYVLVDAERLSVAEPVSAVQKFVLRTELEYLMCGAAG